MDEFRLQEAEFVEGDTSVGFKRPVKVNKVQVSEPGEFFDEPSIDSTPVATAATGPKGTPISSPMTGIYYSAPSPNAAAFVNLGDTVTAGQVVALVEAMKVFNEITSPVSGTVEALTATNGAVVNPGEPLLYIV